MFECWKSEKEVVMVLVGHGSDVCALDCDGLLPLTHAAIHGQVSLALEKDM
jgi:ankyrin repeat protein